MRSNKADAPRSSIAANGHSNLVNRVADEARREIEEKYADEWNASGRLRRWSLRKRIEREIAAVIAERTADVSPDALF